MKNKYFCEHCGSKLKHTIKSADSLWIKGDYKKYNLYTGIEQLMDVYSCPNGWKKSFITRKKYFDNFNHTQFSIRKNF